MESQQIFVLMETVTELGRELKETQLKLRALAEAVCDFIPAEGQPAFRTRVEQYELVVAELDFTKPAPAAVLHGRDVLLRPENHQERVAG